MLFLALPCATALAQGQGGFTKGPGQGGSSSSSTAPNRGGIGAPEISPALAVGGVLLLAGGALILTSKRRAASN